MFELSARVGALIVHTAQGLGVAPERLRQLTGFDPAAASDPDARISFEQEEALWEHAAELSRWTGTTPSALREQRA